MKCQNCGRKIKSGENFCGECATPVKFSTKAKKEDRMRDNANILVGFTAIYMLPAVLFLSIATNFYYNAPFTGTNYYHNIHLPEFSSILVDTPSWLVFLLTWFGLTTFAGYVYSFFTLKPAPTIIRIMAYIWMGALIFNAVLGLIAGISAKEQILSDPYLAELYRNDELLHIDTMSFTPCLLIYLVLLVYIVLDLVSNHFLRSAHRLQKANSEQ